MIMMKKPWTTVIAISMTLIFSLIYLNCGEDVQMGPTLEDIEGAKAKVKQANEAFGNAVRAVRDLNIETFDDIDQVDDISGFKIAHDLYVEALALDPNNLDASLGVAITEIIILKDNNDLQKMRDEWQDYVNSDPGFYDGVGVSLFKISPPTSKGDLSLNEETFSRSLLNTSKAVFFNPPLASEMQRVVRETIIPAADVAIERMKKVVESDDANTYTFVVSSQMQGGTPSEPEDPVELDLTDFKAFYANLLSSRATLRIFLAYDLDVASYDSSDLVNAWEQNSDFFTLKDGNEIKKAKDDLIEASNLILQAIQFLRDETDNQDDDFITVDPGEEKDLDDIEDAVNKVLTSLNGEITLTDDFDENENTPDASLTISLKAFFENPPQRPKQLLPSYVIERDDVEGDQFVWTADSIDAWVFPDPTFSGLLPGMTDAKLKEIFGLTFVPGDIDLEIDMTENATTPGYSWNDSPIYILEVTRLSDFQVVWRVRDQNFENTIFSPVTHGTVPPTAVQEVATQVVLTPGQLYRIYIEREGRGLVGHESETRDFRVQ
jgi:hypothetical protein